MQQPLLCQYLKYVTKWHLFTNSYFPIGNMQRNVLSKEGCGWSQIKAVPLNLTQTSRNDPHPPTYVLWGARNRKEIIQTSHFKTTEV